MNKFILLLFVTIISSCASKHIKIDRNVKLDAIVAKIKKDPESVTYLNFFNAYLESSQGNNTQLSHDIYNQKQQALSEGKLNCAQYDWNKLTDLNVISLAPHLLAIECFETVGDIVQQKEHENIVNFIVTGILGNHSGETFYDAYEVTTWGDAEDLLEYAGLNIIDSYFEFKAKRSGLYRIYITSDDENTRRKIYFDNQRYLHAVLGIQYPFAGLNDHMYQSVILSLKDSDYAAQLAEANVLHAKNKYKEAEDSYLKAIALGSVKANVDLGKLCLSGNAPNFAKDECVQLFVTAAEEGQENAKVYLAYMAYSGIGIDKDDGCSSFESTEKLVGVTRL